MTDKVKKQVEWVISKLLLQANGDAVILLVYEKEENEARIYQNGEKVATISEEASSFGWPLTKEEIEKLYEGGFNEGNKNKVENIKMKQLTACMKDAIKGEKNAVEITEEENHD